MAIPYPSELPDPLRNGFTSSQESNVLRSSVDVGEAKMRRRYTKPIVNEKWSLQLTATNLSIFLNWFENDINSGVLRFEYTDVITGVLSEFRIVDMYTLTPYGTCGEYIAAFNVEKLP